ncbi:MFS transporter [Phenylobacterium aquaticum]|uniref:MFS transporter n=1 Tax=Phenylobacterium aquaticum TaxID=1763816 RepID=UPI0026E9E467|nr:MFS transporter [Phenylobacterium aquaticum]
MTSPRALWRDPDFARLWAAQAVSSFGARITREGLPILAVTTLSAAPASLGVLAAIANGAALVVGLSAGGFVDRRARRPVLIAADLARALVLISIPLAAALGRLSIAQVFLVGGLVASCSVVFDMASHAYLPGVVGPDRLVEGNSRLATTESLAEIGGPALAGLLFQVLSAPFALAVNAGTYLASAGFLSLIRRHEPAPEPEPPAHWTAEVTQGLSLAWAEPRVRALLLMGLVQGLFGGVFSALYILFALKTLHLPTTVLGLAIACGGAGALLGAGLGPWLAKRIGAGPAIIVSITGASLSAMAISLAPTDRVGATVVMIATQITGDAFGVSANLLMISLRQALLPQAVLGRVSGAFQASAGGLGIVGALGGGWLGGAIGPRAAILGAAIGFLLIPLIAVLSPIRKVGEISAGSASTG